MNRSQRRSALVLAVLGISATVTAVHGQTTDTWTGNAGDSLWPTGGNWSAGNQPGTSDTALFNGATGSGAPTISLGGTSQSTGAIQFTGSTPYFVGASTSDTLTINNNSISSITSGTTTYSPSVTVPVSAADGALDVGTATTANQEIDANITFTGTNPFITNSAPSITFSLGSTTSPGVMTIANGSSLILQPKNYGTIALNDSIQVDGGGVGTVLTTTSTTGTVAFNSATSNYSGQTILAGGNNDTILIGASTDTNSSSTFTEGPFGKSTIVFANSSNSTLAAAGSGQTIANPISLLYGMTIGNASSVTAYSLTFAGPITTVSNGRTLKFSTPQNTETLGVSPNSTTFMLGSGTTSATNTTTVNAVGATIVLNDTIVDASGQHSALTYSTSSSSYTGTFVIAGSNTYSGGTTFGTTPQQQVIDILSDSSADGTSGPFGAGSITFNSSEPAVLEPVNSDRTIANPISLPGHGFFAYSYGTTPYNLTFSGPITTSGGFSTNNMIAGAVLYLGSSAAPSTITANGAAFSIQGQFTTGDVTNIYDSIQNGANAGSFVVQAAGASSSDVEIVNLFGNNTYTNGTTIKSGGIVTTSTNLSNGTLNLLGSSTYGGAKATVSAQAMPGATAGVTVVPALTIDTASAATNSTFDITNNGLVVQNGSLTNIQNYITSGAATDGSGASHFTGPGITSSLAAAVAADSGNSHKTAIGYGLASAVLGITSGPGTFLGQTVNPADVLVRYTLAGDANLDGTVNALDFNALATNYGDSGTTWVQGDYNYDGTINSEDFDLLANNYGSTIANAAISSQPAVAALGAVVPEPTTIGLVGLSLLALRRRRNK